MIEYAFIPDTIQPIRAHVIYICAQLARETDYDRAGVGGQAGTCIGKFA